jgi:hypothetical protein
MMNPEQLTDSRIQLYYAIQCIAAEGAALGTPQTDSSQMSLDWNSTIKGFVGSEILGDRPGSHQENALFTLHWNPLR